MGISPLGIFHTVIGVVAIIAALIAFVRYGRIDLNKSTGKIYFWFTLITSLTALGISKTGKLNPGHVLSLLVVILIVAAWYLNAKKKDSNRSRYFENFYLSFSFFLSMLPTVNETFTRVPVGHPLAKDITDPIIGKTLLVILLLFISGSVYQIIKQKKINNLSIAKAGS